MVFYYTSANIKILRNVLLDYEDAGEVSPYEYMKIYVEKCPSSVDDQKLTWIAEAFLGHHKHFAFLKETINHLADDLSEEERDYFMILLYAITFQLEPTEMTLLYKSIFNLSKSLLNTFTVFLSNNEMLTYISQVAQNYYDAVYVTDKIIAPLFVWQPYISEMAHNYAEYVKKMESRRTKAPTVAITPNVLTRKGKEPAKSPSQPSLFITPPNSVDNKNKKMLTKSVIDRRLKDIHEQNKLNAACLLQSVKDTKKFHYARKISDNKYYKRLSYDEPVMTGYTKPNKIVSKSTIPVRENIAAIKRLNQRVQMTEQEEMQWIQNLMSCCRNPSGFEEMFQKDRDEKQKDRLYEIEKNHLMGLISYEEAIIAKKKVEEQNKKKYQEFLKEKEKWEEAIQNWKKTELEKRHAHIENISLLELNVLEARNSMAEKKKEDADKLKKETEEKLAEAMRLQQEALDEKIKMIKQIKILSVIAKKSKVPKIIDLTETSGVGLLCEMSIAELQERLVAVKNSIKEELQQRKNRIKEDNEAAKKELEDTKNCIKSFIKERAEMRKQAKSIKNKIVLEDKSSKVINDLKKTLEEKKKLRFKLDA